MAKEMVPTVLSRAVWGCQLAHKTVLFQCDNTGVVAAVKKGTAKEELVMHLQHSLWFFVAHFDISVSIEHIAGPVRPIKQLISYLDITCKHSFVPTHRSVSSQPLSQPSSSRS